MVFEYQLNPQTDNWMQDFFWDSWADEVFMSQTSVLVSKATELGWTDRWVFPGYASTINKLWRFTGTGNGNNTDPGEVTEYHWSTGAEDACPLDGRFRQYGSAARDPHALPADW